MSLSHELSASARVLSAPLKPHCFTDKGSVTQEFKKAMRRLTSTVTLIATEHEGAPFGMAATAVTSVCTDPSSILVCINHRGKHVQASDWSWKVFGELASGWPRRLGEGFWWRSHRPCPVRDSRLATLQRPTVSAQCPGFSFLHRCPTHEPWNPRNNHRARRRPCRGARHHSTALAGRETHRFDTRNALNTRFSLLEDNHENGIV